MALQVSLTRISCLVTFLYRLVKQACRCQVCKGQVSVTSCLEESQRWPIAPHFCFLVVIFCTQISLFVQVVTVLFLLFHSFCIPEDKLILGLFGEHGEVKAALEIFRPLVNCSSCNISSLIIIAEQTEFHSKYLPFKERLRSPVKSRTASILTIRIL